MILWILGGDWSFDVLTYPNISISTGLLQNLFRFPFCSHVLYSYTWVRRDSHEKIQCANTNMQI